jgi:AraC-like DNA-binding protein
VAYSSRALADTVERLLSRSPARSLSSVARALGVSVRTVRRALRMQREVTYRELQARAILEGARGLADSDVQRSSKEVAFALGFGSARSFSRRMKSIARNHPSAGPRASRR